MKNKCGYIRKRAIFTGLCVLFVIILGIGFIIKAHSNNGNTPKAREDSVQPTFVPPAKTYESFETLSPTKAPQETFNKHDAEGFLAIVNFEHTVERGYRPQGMVRINSIFKHEALLESPEGYIDETAAKAAKLMFSDALRYGIPKYLLTTAFRSVSYQEKLFMSKVKECGSNYGKNPYQNPVSVMPGGASEHHTGLALDILSENYREADDGYGETVEGRWLAQNAHKYGFVLRYPKGKEHITGVIYEPWHFRYVGLEHAKYMYENGLCLEEYVSG